MDIKVIDRPGGPKGKLYYELRPYYHQDCKIVTPVDSDKTVIRPLLTRDEALCLIDRIQGVKEMEVTQDKQREERYKEALKTCDCHVGQHDQGAVPAAAGQDQAGQEDDGPG